MYKDDGLQCFLSQFSAYYQHLYKQNHLHPSLELWKGLKNPPSQRQRQALSAQRTLCNGMNSPEAAAISLKCTTADEETPELGSASLFKEPN